MRHSNLLFVTSSIPLKTFLRQHDAINTVKTLSCKTRKKKIINELQSLLDAIWAWKKSSHHDKLHNRAGKNKQGLFKKCHCKLQFYI